MAKSELIMAIEQLCDEKNIPFESVIDSIESALAVAYRKEYGNKNLNCRVEFNPEDGTSQIYDVKEVVADPTEEELAAVAAEEKEREQRRLERRDFKREDKREEKKEGEEGILEKINYDSYFLIKINLTGSYENLVNFIHIFENDQFYVNIFSVNIQKIQKEELNLANGTEINSQSGAEAGVLRENPFLDFPISEDKNSVQAISEKIEIVPEKKEFLNSSIEAIVYKRK